MKLTVPKAVCQIYLPSIGRFYGRNALIVVDELLDKISKVGFWGVYLIALFEDGGYDNGFDVVEYNINPAFGDEAEFKALTARAHELGLQVGVDVVPNHVSDKHALARKCLEGVSGFEDCLYLVSESEAEQLTAAGVPSLFGDLAYSPIDGRYIRTTFADYHQLNLNWESEAVQQYFSGVFAKFRQWKVDFARVDCGMMLLEDVTKADPQDPLACIVPEKSVAAVRDVAGGMPLFFEWFDPENVRLFEGMPECWALDCSFVMSGRLEMANWGKHPKLVPLVGGHDQMTLADRGISLREAAKRMLGSEYAFLDIPTLVGWTTTPQILPGDADYDADLGNINQRYRARRSFEPILRKFLRM